MSSVFDQCQYKGCRNRKSEDTKLFRFPSQNKEKCEVWITNSGNGLYLRTWAPSSIRKAGICPDHFSPESFWDETLNRLRPKQNPIPYTAAVEDDEEAEKRMEDNRIIEIEEEDFQKRTEEGTGIRMEENSSEIVGREEKFEKRTLEEDIETRMEEDSRDIRGEEEKIQTIEEEDERETCEGLEKTATGSVQEVEGPTLAETSHNEEDYLRVNKTHVLKTYPAAAKENQFITVDEDNDEMEWSKVEPPLPSTSSDTERKCSTLSTEQKIANITKGLTNKFKKLRNGDDKQKRKMARKIKILQEKLKTQKKEIAALKRKKVSLNEFLDAHHCKNPVSRAMVTLQLRKGNRRFTKNEKDLAQRFNYYSNSAYRHLQQAGLKLPSLSSIRSWIAEYDIRPGFSDVIFDKLKEKMEKLPPQQRICGLKWDDFSCKKYEEYSKYCDLIEGLVDLGPLGRRNVPATNVLVFSVDSLDAENPYTQPLAYFLIDKSVTGEVIADLVKRCLLKLADCGADVRLLTCDQAATNQNCLWKSFGATKEEPSFEYEGRTYFCSFDFPHLIKRLLTQLRTHQYLYDAAGKIIANFQNYVAAWNYDRKSKTSNLLGHITEAHMSPNNWECMNVKRTFQFFSKRFAAAIRLAGADPESGISATWKLTAAFTEEMDRVIDGCNAYKLRFLNPAKRPLSSRNPEIEERLKNFVNWSSTWTTNPKTKSKAPCLKGLPFSINAILRLYAHIKKDFPNFDLAVGLCNQDSLEHLFSKIRQRGGHNNNPTGRMVRLCLRHILSSGKMKGGTGANVEIEDKDLVLLINTSSDVEKAFGKNGKELLAEELKAAEEEDDIQRKDIETTAGAIERNEDLILQETEGLSEKDFVDLSTQEKEDSNHLLEGTSFYEENAVTFYAGYVAGKCFLRSKCEACRENTMKTPMEESQDNEYYIRLREYRNLDEDAPEVEKLTRPTDQFTKIIHQQLKSFDFSWENYWASDNLLQNLSEEAEKQTKQHFPEWFRAADPCYEHRLDALKFMLRVKIFAKTRERNGQRKAQSYQIKKKGRKVSIVMNN